MTNKVRKILLLQPWIEDFYITDCRIQPIGLAYLAGSLRHHFPDIEVRIYDALAGGGKRSIPWPGEFVYLKRYYGHPDSGPFSLFHHFYRFGKSVETIVHDLKDMQPGLIGISSLFTPYYRQSLALARICRQLFPLTPIVMGGSHATMSPQTLLSPDNGDGGCDYILSGEAEESICQLVEMLQGDRTAGAVAGLITRENPAKKTDNHLSDTLTSPSPPSPLKPSMKKKSLNWLPPPAFTGLKMADYQFAGRPMTFLITSRSCPHRCTFCSIHSVFGLTYSIRPAADIFQEILHRYNDGIRHFDIEDDNFTVNHREVEELLDRVIEHNLPITFSAMNGLSYISLNEKILTKMRRAGFSTLNLALVSSDKLVLEFTQRPHTLEKFHEILTLAEQLDYRVTAYYILGMPRQTIAEMWQTLMVLAGSRCLVGASPFYFTPGSPIHRKENGNPTLRLASQPHHDVYLSSRLTALDVESDDFDRDDIYTLFRLTRTINYIKEGIDRHLSGDDPYFTPAQEVFAHGRWFAVSRRGKVPLPFSQRVQSLMCQQDLIIKGFRTARGLAWDQAHKCFIDANQISCDDHCGRKTQ